MELSELQPVAVAVVAVAFACCASCCCYLRCMGCFPVGPCYVCLPFLLPLRCRFCYCLCWVSWLSACLCYSMLMWWCHRCCRVGGYTVVYSMLECRTVVCCCYLLVLAGAVLFFALCCCYACASAVLACYVHVIVADLSSCLCFGVLALLVHGCCCAICCAVFRKSL